jgi:ABC-type transport system, involved in lipoprotein release, permease component
MLSLSLALRQLVTGKKNYIGVSCIAAILFFFLILINGMAKWGGDGGKNVISMFSNFDSDISINYLDPGIKAAVETQISQLAGTKASFYDRSEYIMINGVQMHATAINDPKEYTTVYQGRTCSYENEILITQYVADEFHIGIGDKIVITKGNQKAEYMVSGIYQCANDMGANIAMSLAGLEKLKDSPEEQAESGKDKITRYTYEYKLKDSQKKELLISTLKKKYMATQIAIESDDTFNGMSAISSAIKALSFLVYLIAAVFTMVTIALVSGRIIKKETKDYGIFKSIGYTSSNLRLQIAFRMGITAGIGGLFGIILVFLCGKKSIMFLLHFMGVYHYNMQIHVQSLLLVFIGLVLFFIFVTYLFTRKIKGISVKMLMAQ